MSCWAVEDLNLGLSPCSGLFQASNSIKLAANDTSIPLPTLSGRSSRLSLGVVVVVVGWYLSSTFEEGQASTRSFVSYKLSGPLYLCFSCFLISCWLWGSAHCTRDLH